MYKPIKREGLVYVRTADTNRRVFYQGYIFLIINWFWGFFQLQLFNENTEFRERHFFPPPGEKKRLKMDRTDRKGYSLLLRNFNRLHFCRYLTTPFAGGEKQFELLKYFF
jgi:hypothetical protein